MYFAWARSKVKVYFYFHISENVAHLGKYSTLGENNCSVTIWPILLLNSVQIVSLT